MGAMDAAPVGTRGQSATATSLSQRDAAILDFERTWWQYAGAREQAVRDPFGLPATRDSQALNALIDREDALAHDPLLVRRLRRMRHARQRARSARRLGIELS